MKLRKQDESTLVHAVCPKCHKEHVLVIRNSKSLLDGTPAAPIDELLESVHVCDCGMLITKTYFPESIMNNPGYQEGLQHKDEVLKKIALLHSTTGDDTVLMYYAQYYHLRKDNDAEQQALLNAIQALEDGTDTLSLFVPAGEFLSMHTHYDAYRYPEDRLIDLYRRTRQTDKAMKLIQERRTREYEVFSRELFAFLKLEEKLLRTHNYSPK